MTLLDKVLMVVLVMVLSSSNAVAITNLHTADSLELSGSITNGFVLEENGPNPRIAYVEANSSWFPREDNHQKIISLTTDPPATNVGDSLAFYFSHPTLGEHSFSINYRVRTDAHITQIRDKVEFPIRKLDDDIIPFTKHTKIIDNNDRISSLASRLAGNEDDLFKVVVKLGVWTKQNIEYNLSTMAAEASQPSSWVLENREGVCDEMTNLFISMLRSLGIPAKFVSGVSFTDSPLFSNQWGAHGWSEVYFPGHGWIPFDVTYGQLGWTDATHIKLAEGVDSSSYATSYSWSGKNVDLITRPMDLETTVSKKGISSAPIVDLSLEAVAEKVNFGSYNVLKATVKNKKDYYVTNELMISQTEGLELLDPWVQQVVLEPFESKKVVWRVRVSDELDDDYLYTFPVQVASQRNATARTEFEASRRNKFYARSWADRFVGSDKDIERKSDTIGFSCFSEQAKPYINETVNITCNIDNSQSDKVAEVVVCLERCISTSVPAGGGSVVKMKTRFSEQGWQSLQISSTCRGVTSFAYVPIEVVQQPKIIIDNLRYPEVLDYDKVSKITFDVVSSSSAQTHKLMVSLESRRVHEKWAWETFTGKNSFEIKIPGSILLDDKEDFKIVVKYLDDRDKPHELEKGFSIKLGAITFLERIERWIRRAFM